MIKKNLPKLKISIDKEYSDGEELGVNNIAFVKNPAIMVKGMAFSTDAKPLSFADNLKYRIVAPALIPMEIYRRDDKDGEYYVEFTAEEIDRIHQKFMASLPTNGFFNLEHNMSEQVPAYLLEAWIVEDPMTDKAYTKFGIEVPSGTLMITSQITDKDYYNQLVENDQVGYSVEGFFGLALSEINKQKIDMKKQEFKLADGSTLEVFEDGSTNIVLAEMPEDKEEEVVEEEKEEEVLKKDDEEYQEEVVEDEVVEEKVDTVVEAYSKEEIDAKFEELYKIVAELQVGKDDKPMDEMAPMEYSVHDRLSEFVRFAHSNQ